jgi:hypothetical protein
MKTGKQVSATGRDELLMNPAMVAAWALLLPVCVWPISAGEPPVSRAVRAETWDVASDTWVATDALGRRVPTHEEVGAPRADRTIGVFYFLWHGSHVQGGPYDVTKILIEDPQAMEKPDSPLWGPLLAPHHWGESIFGYYLTDDASVLRKHAQMLGDAGVDVIVFDVTNQATYKPYYMALLRVFSEVRAQGGHTPQVAFLCPFWDPPRVVAELYKDLYEPQLYADLWFRWDGKPLILADPDLLGRMEGVGQLKDPAELIVGHTLGQSFTITEPAVSVGGCFPNWATQGAGMTLSLHREGPNGELLATHQFTNVGDCEWLALQLERPLAAGTYYLEMSQPVGKIGWWSPREDSLTGGQAFVDGKPVDGDRTLRIVYGDERSSAMREFFTFRTPQPDYFRGPTRPNMWSWLEVYPQHVFRNGRGEKEQMSVGVAQNAVDNRLATMCEPGAKGRSFRGGATVKEPDAVLHGYNVTEQWDRALSEDPRFIFVTGWNEWIAGRFAEFLNVKLPVMFVDQFDHEHSRDIEPMRGGHGDNYYYQMVSYIRRYKGARPLPEVASQPIQMDGQFADWANVTPEFRDTIGDPVRRDHAGYGSAGPYVNMTGRNDIVAAKVSCVNETIYVYARTQQPLTSRSDPNWMLLYLDIDQNPATGWLGYDYVLNRQSGGEDTATLEKNQGDYTWGGGAPVACRVAGCEIEVAIPLAALNLAQVPAYLDFKWADNIQQTGEVSDFTLNGDVAPNDRFNYRAKTGGN